MTDNIEFSSDPLIAAMQKSLLEKKEVASPEVVETPTPKVETPEAKAEAKVEAPAPKAESLPGKIETPEGRVEIPETKARSFDEELFEKTGGKIKTFAEIEYLMNAPKVEMSERIARLHELEKSGVEINETFWALQSKNYEAIENPVEAMLEAMRLDPENKGLSESALEFQIRKKYNLDQWAKKVDGEWVAKDERDEYEMTEEDKFNHDLLARDGVNKRDWLVEYKNKHTLAPKVDPEAQKALALEQEQNQKNWESYVDAEIVNKITKLSIPVDDKGNSFDYDLSEQDRQEVGKMMKELTKDPMVFFGQFLEQGKDGKVTRNHAALALTMLKARNMEKAVALAYADGAAKEALRLEKESKNTNFKESETGSQKSVPLNVNEALKTAVQQMKI